MNTFKKQNVHGIVFSTINMKECMYSNSLWYIFCFMKKKFIATRYMLMYNEIDGSMFNSWFSGIQ